MVSDVLFIVNLVSAVLMVLAILLQRSEGGLGALGGDQGSSAAFSSAGTGNAMTKATSILVCIFMLSSLALAVQTAGDARPESVVESESTHIEIPAVPEALSGENNAL